MPRQAIDFQRYHQTFHGDTYDACAQCGGTCEQYRAGTLMPGEKEFMAGELGLAVDELAATYLDAFDTPYGLVEVVKMKPGCPFLDATFRCGAGALKPVLCDTYPIVFAIRQGRVHFSLDEADCPMTTRPAYAPCCQRFVKVGIPALRRLRAPLAWWRIVALYDEFDFDYERLERKLRTTGGCETFWLEDVLGFVFHGDEAKARRRGMQLLGVRLTQAAARARATLATAKSPPRLVRRLVAAYRQSLAATVGAARKALGQARTDHPMLTEPSGVRYRRIVAETRELLRRLAADTDSCAARLREARRLPPLAQSSPRRAEVHLL